MSSSRTKGLICALIVRLPVRPNLQDSRYTPCAFILSPLGAHTSALCYCKHSCATNACKIFGRLTLTDICLQEGKLMCSFVAFRADILLISMSYFQCDEEKLRSTLHMLLLLQQFITGRVTQSEPKRSPVLTSHVGRLNYDKFYTVKSYIQFRHCTTIIFLTALFRGMTRLPEVRCVLQDQYS